MHSWVFDATRGALDFCVLLISPMAKVKPENLPFEEGNVALHHTMREQRFQDKG